MEVFVNSSTGGVSVLLECLQVSVLFIILGFFLAFVGVCVGVDVCARGGACAPGVLWDAPLYIPV